MHGQPTGLIDKILARSTIQPDSCWEYQGTRQSGGYGVIQIGGYFLVHRVVYKAFIGPIPDGWTVDHLCFNRACVNPDHLETVTVAENTRRMHRAGRACTGRWNRVKTHCPNGHPYDAENTYHYGGSRHCRKCRQARSAAYDANRIRSRKGKN